MSLRGSGVRGVRGVRDDTALLRVGLAAGEAALRIKRAARASQRLARLAETDPDITLDTTVQCAADLASELGYLGENDSARPSSPGGPPTTS